MLYTQFPVQNCFVFLVLPMQVSPGQMYSFTQLDHRELQH